MKLFFGLFSVAALLGAPTFAVSFDNCGINYKQNASSYANFYRICVVGDKDFTQLETDSGISKTQWTYVAPDKPDGAEDGQDVFGGAALIRLFQDVDAVYKSGEQTLTVKLKMVTLTKTIRMGDRTLLENEPFNTFQISGADSLGHPIEAYLSVDK